ncbi:choice-of-anchor D domain-containing protein [Paraconexibacter antarcticus]|uniref:Choice-of-anchor D domain-containing protein n=1 Tax=Paraconexibacter antarcticus TaxID=2949664 RepID=A0ABY5DX21_9ACTN|nr:choice-of-anchor D domain-containing protein [Paraconexibacter antarcticus]UTI65656.1 choice-of-anchor D domain-containing protein [Paraconexibacter antarcticus]
MRFWKLLTGLGVLAVLAFGTAALVHGGAGHEGTRPLSEQEREAKGGEPKAEEHEKQDQREIAKKLHADKSGKLRADLYLKASKQWATQKVDASVTIPKGSTSTAPGVSPSIASGGGVVGVQWTQIGPAPLVVDKEQNYQGAGPDAGQAVSIAIDPRNATDKTVYAGFNDGGVWKTTDGGDNWAPLTDQMPSLSTGAVALDPADPSTVYVGTGNIYNNGFFKGVGVYRSSDGGATWALTGDSAKLNGIGINQIVMPAANTLLVATNQGLWRSSNQGDTFTQVSVGGTTGQFITDIDLDTQNPSTVYASVSGKGIFASTDGGATFPASGNLWSNPGAPATGTYRFVSFAQSTTDSGNTMYADAQSTGGTSRFGGMWKSTDGGANWSSITSQADAGGQLDKCQCGYDQTIGVDPVDENKVYIGFQELWYSSDGGASNFTNISDSKAHWDHHALVFSPPSHRTSGDTTTRVWLGTDGGVHYTDDAGGSYTQRNGKIATNLFRAMDIGRGSAANNGYSYGGAQDTGTMARRPGDTDTQWHEAVDADGGPVAVDWQQPKNAFGISNSQFIRTSDGGDNWTRPGSSDLSCTPTTGAAAVDPNDGQKVFVPVNNGTLKTDASGNPVPCPETQGNGIFRSTDGGANFPASGFVGTSGTPTFLATTPTDSNVMYVALSSGKVAVSTNIESASPTFTDHTVPGAPGAPIQIAIDPSNTNTAVVVFAGYSSTAAGALSRHVFRTTDGGSSWTDIGGTAGVANQMVPDTPLYSVVIDPQVSPHAVIVSTDFGILRTSDGGGTWQILGVGMPNVNVTSLQLDSSVTPSLLRAGTYGRSAFELTTASGPQLQVNCDLGFGFTDVGSTATKQCTLFNVGSADLHVNSFTRSAGSAEFSILSGPSTPVTIAPGSHIDYTIQFAPSSAGDKSATFSVNSDDPSNPVLQLPASGTGVVGQIALSGSLNFGVVARGQTKDKDVIVQNVGKGTLKLSSVTITGDPMFSIVTGPTPPVSVAPGSQVTYTVRFAPPADAGPGTHTATFSIASNDPSSPTTLGATGDVGVPTFSLSTTHLAFGGVPVDNRTTPSSKTLTTTISNQSSCPGCDLTVTGLAISGPDAGDFALVSPPSTPYTVSAGNSLDLQVRFNPPIAGGRTATLTITTDDPSHPSFDVALDGTGLIPAIDAATAPLIFGPTVFTPACGTLCGSTLTEKLTNSGAAELIVDQVTFPSSPEFSGPGATTPPTRVQVGSSFDEPVTFTPTAAGKRTGTLHVEDSFLDPGDTQPAVTKDVALCGEAVGRGIRVLVVNKAGTPVPKVDMLKLQANGVSSPPNVNLKNLPLKAVTTSCNPSQEHYENQNLSSTDQTAPKSSYYTLNVAVGNKKTTVTFGLKVNEFKLIVLTVG